MLSINSLVYGKENADSLGNSVTLGIADTLRQSGFPSDSVYSDIYLDTVQIKTQSMINDYSMIGVQYGPAISRVMFNPIKDDANLLTRNNIGIFFTKYQKMFKFMPYFGYQIGLIYGQDGYRFKTDKEGFTPNVDGATKVVYDYVEVPVMAHFHKEAGIFKIFANLGTYGAYRLNVKREGESVPEKYRQNFYDYDNRFEFGARGGLGLALMFSPVEFHVSALVKYSFQSLYRPDYSSEYAYRFAYPFGAIISAGIHIQLTRPKGKTRAQLRQEAYDIVFSEDKQQNNIK